jgi:transposase-like protein
MDKRGRPKGGENRYWSKEAKYRIIKEYLDDKIGLRELCRREKISTAQIHKWKKAYLEKGPEGLENSKKPRNPLLKYQNKKELSEVEQLEYENMKLRIENARLKKGYTNEEVVAIRQKKSSKKNMR